MEKCLLLFVTENELPPQKPRNSGDLKKRKRKEVLS